MAAATFDAPVELKAALPGPKTYGVRLASSCPDSNLTSSTITLEWTPPDASVDVGAVGFITEYCSHAFLSSWRRVPPSAPHASPLHVDVHSAPVCTLAGLQPATPYLLRVAAVFLPVGATTGSLALPASGALLWSDSCAITTLSVEADLNRSLRTETGLREALSAALKEVEVERAAHAASKKQASDGLLSMQRRLRDEAADAGAQVKLQLTHTHVKLEEARLALARSVGEVEAARAAQMQAEAAHAAAVAAHAREVEGIARAAREAAEADAAARREEKASLTQQAAAAMQRVEALTMELDAVRATLAANEAAVRTLKAALANAEAKVAAAATAQASAAQTAQQPCIECAALREEVSALRVRVAAALPVVDPKLRAASAVSGSSAASMTSSRSAPDPVQRLAPPSHASGADPIIAALARGRTPPTPAPAPAPATTPAARSVPAPAPAPPPTSEGEGWFGCCCSRPAKTKVQ